jgi:hypothetical protein
MGKVLENEYGVRVSAIEAQLEFPKRKTKRRISRFRGTT